MTTPQLCTLSSGCVSSNCVPYLNQTAFVLPAIGSSGNVGKDSLTGPNVYNWDVGMLKNIALGSDRYRIQFHAELFNVLNHTTLNNPTSTVSSAGFGTITSAADPRIGQLALKLIF